MSIIMMSPVDIRHAVAERSRAARLAADLSQEGLAERAGVSLGSLKRFERTGAASLDTVIRIAFALKLEGGFSGLFERPKFMSLEEVVARPKERRRGRRK